MMIGVNCEMTLSARIFINQSITQLKKPDVSLDNILMRKLQKLVFLVLN